MGRYGLLTKLEVKMAGFFFFLCVFINSQKKSKANSKVSGPNKV